MREEMENVDKCMALTVTLIRRPLTTKYTLHSYPLASVNSAKYLGVTIDSFNDHIDTICKKANSTISFLHRISVLASI